MENNNSTPSDPALPYLSEVIDVNAFKKGRLNIIVAPCHSGKTTATSKLIEAHTRCPERVLYLIDTTAGKDSLVMHNEAQRYKNMWLRDIKIEWWGERPDGDGFRVMTYHHFGQALTGNGPDLFQDLDLIICDEMHNLVKYIGIESGFNMSHKMTKTINEVTICRDALNALCTLASKKEHTPLVLALTATPEPLTKKLDSMKETYRIVDYTGLVRYDQTLQVYYYADLDTVIEQLPRDEKVLIYVPRIDMIKEHSAKFSSSGRKVGCLWGLRNLKHKMDDTQLAIRDVILKDEHIPDDIDVLFINAAYETSININNDDFNTMIVHNSNSAVQTQVRGRLRHHINTLYLYDKNHQHISQYFPEEYLWRILTSEETAEIVKRMDLDNGNGRQMKWPSIAEALTKDGLIVQHFKHQGKWCWRVDPTSLTPVKQEVCA